MRGEADAASRVVSGPDPDRFYCPFPGCNRSFAELWRLKVHFRAPPDVRGSGKERGHGTELKYCPKCGKELKPGKHHVGCTAGKSAPRQAAKRQKQMSSTTETGDWVTQSSPSDSVDYEEDEEDDESIRERSRYSNLESAVRRRASRAQRRQSGKSSSGAPARECRLENHLKRNSAAAGTKNEENGELLFTDKRSSDYPYSIAGDDLPFLDAIDSKDLPREYDKEHLLPDLHDLQKDVMRAPSPPPLPSDWDLGPTFPSGGAGLLFDFDQFDEAKRPRLGGAGGVGEPLMTVTSAMNPSEVSNPSDDYIWQILFAGENDPVPRRVTAHLHNPIDRAGASPDLVGVFDDIPDDIVGNDLGFPSNSKDRHVPPPPPEAWEMVGKKEEEGQTVTVTYVVKDGQYVVKRVEPTTDVYGLIPNWACKPAGAGYGMMNTQRLLNAKYSSPGQRVVVRSSSSDLSTVPLRKLGKSSLEVSEMGIGAWSWGDRSNYWQGWEKEACREAYEASMRSGLTFLDTAEVYGFGLSEELVCDFMKSSKVEAKPVIATKFAPLPWRQRPESVVEACKASLKRLGVEQVGLYMQHWPGFFLNAFSNDAFLEGFVRCYEAGLTQAVGVSNFNSNRVKKASKYFESSGLCLASNQVQYSLLYREPERNGVLESCQENGVTLVAYSPLCQGLLSGKYSKENPPVGPRKAFFTESRYKDISVLLDLLRKIGDEHKKSPTQVALNWTLCKGTLPIPGVRNASQVEEVLGAVGWRLSDGEISEMDSISGRIPSSTGAPFENW